jgi:hypothetical protein
MTQRMSRAPKVGDEITLTATILKVMEGGVSSVSLPSYNFPLAVDSPAKAKPGQIIEIRGFATRIDKEDGKVTIRIDGGGLVTVDADSITSMSATSWISVRQ